MRCLRNQAPSLRYSLLLFTSILVLAYANESLSTDAWEETQQQHAGSSIERLLDEEVSESNPVVGGEMETSSWEGEEKHLAFLTRELNRISKKCNGSSIKSVKILKMTKQIVAGAAYKISATVDGAPMHITMLRNVGEQVHPTHGPKKGDSPNKHSKTYGRDKYQIVFMEPHLCPMNTLVSLVSEEEFTNENRQQSASNGLIIPEDHQFITEEESTLTQEEIDSLPSSFDWRENMPSGSNAKATQVLNQGGCGSCWAFGAATAYAYRLNHKSDGHYDAVPSPQVGMYCGKSDPCNGGWFSTYWNPMAAKPIPAHRFVPYKARSRGTKCSHTANSISYKTKYPQYYSVGNGEENMMREIMTNGACGMALDGGPSAFSRYKSGVAQGASKKLTHAVVVLGWGSQDGLKYWIVQNSWGAGWGDKGFIKIERGKNTLNSEKYGCLATTVDTDKMDCKDAPKCHNGGAFHKDCSCQCGAGYTGATCNGCTKTCSGDQFSGSASITDNACRCGCAAGYITPSSLVGYGDCAHQWLFGGKSGPSVSMSTGAINFAFSEHGTKPSDTLQRVKHGDILIGVPSGTVPWTEDDGWNTEIRGSVCGPKTWPARACGSSEGTLSISEAGTYDIYYVKYNGMSEFGNDKGYGSDFVKLPTQLEVTADDNGDGGSNPLPAPPTASPTDVPTASPTDVPTASPTDVPTASPTDAPTASPAPPSPPPPPPPAPRRCVWYCGKQSRKKGWGTVCQWNSCNWCVPCRSLPPPPPPPPPSPTASPTTASPTDAPTASPTDAPTASPTDAPTSAPTSAPTPAPTTTPPAPPPPPPPPPGPRKCVWYCGRQSRKKGWGAVCQWRSCNGCGRCSTSAIQALQDEDEWQED